MKRQTTINPHPNSLEPINKHHALTPQGHARSLAPFEHNGCMYAIRGYTTEPTYKHSVTNLTTGQWRWMTSEQFREYFLGVK